MYQNNAPSAPNTPALPSPIMNPASITPSMTAITLDLKSIFRKLAASVPVHAPVPGSGIPTKRSSARNSPRPAFACRALPPFSPFSTQKVKSQHVSDHGHNVRREQRKPQELGIRNRSPQFDNWYHGYQKYNQIIHLCSSFSYFSL